MEPEKNTKQEPAKEKSPLIKSLRTYQGDVEEAISKNHYSASTILVAEQKRREETVPDVVTPEDVAAVAARNKFFVIVGLSLLALGIITVSAIYYLKSREQVVIQQNTKSLIGFTEEKTISVASSTREKLLSNIVSEKNSFRLPTNSVLYINTVTVLGNPEGIEKIISLLAPRMPSPLTRSFAGEYMLGIYSFDTNEPFIILTTDDYASSYAGMLRWEPDMVSDLGKIFSIEQNASSTDAGFTDEALKNKDLRILQDENHKTILLYSFIDKNTLVITTNEKILTAILGKYNVSKQIR